uniref:Glutamate receptor 1 n=1 Tax=Sirex nitobei TaxID=1602346 RepID=A0A857N5D0_9HYME|nr:ionotropic receptor 5 [Sirex nitobei]
MWNVGPFAGVIFILLALEPCKCALPLPLKIGAIFHNGEEQHKAAFEYALLQLKYENSAPAFDLEPIIKWVNIDTDSYSSGLAACELIEEGVAGIFGPGSPYTRGIVSSIAARFDVPHIEFSWRRAEESKIPVTSINLYPNSKDINEAIATLVKSMEWRQFTAIYETNDGLSRIQNALRLHGPNDFPVTVRQLGEGPDYRQLLKEIASSKDSNILLDIESNHIVEVLAQAQEVKLLEDYYNYIITDLDIVRLPIATVVNESRVNITGFRLLNNDSIDVSFELGFKLKVESALLYDSVFLFNEALEVLNARSKDWNTPLIIDPPSLSCSDTEKYSAGPNITGLMREISKVGRLTGPMAFDEFGQRSFSIEIVEYQQNQSVKIATWTNQGLKLIRSTEESEGYKVKSIEKMLLKVTTRLGAPFLMEVTDGSSRGVLIDNKRYEGFSVDLIAEIANILRFKYEFELVPDGRYGSYNHETKSWDGLVKRLLDHDAQLAICDLTITYERERAVDFTMPFMNLGISILYHKAEAKSPNLFSFLSPFSAEVWIYMATAYLGVSVMIFLQARMAPGEWDNPHPCNPDPEELENNFSLMNSLWLTMGSLAQQGSDILPKAPSIRMIAGMWWLFVLIMISSYTANLAAFLTQEKMDETIDSAEDLAMQTKIKYGAVQGGSTSMFFRDSNFSTYQRMWAAMIDAKPSVFTRNNDEGVERVIKGKRGYAFLMESTSIEYRVERDCELRQVGGMLDSKGYGIAMPLNYPYRTIISRAVLTLQEKGSLRELKNKWWKGNGSCAETSTDGESNSNELGMANVGGVFLVLIIGCAASFVMAILEFLWNVRKVAVEEKITPCEALMAELKFAVNIWAETKPVKVAKSSSSSDSTTGGIGRAASVARSIVGSFLRLDVLDKFEKDNTNGKNGNHKI